MRKVILINLEESKLNDERGLSGQCVKIVLFILALFCNDLVADSQEYLSLPFTVSVGAGTSYMANDISSNSLGVRELILRNSVIEGEIEQPLSDWFALGASMSFISFKGQDGVLSRGYQYKSNVGIVSGFLLLDPVSCVLQKKKLSFPYFIIKSGLGGVYVSKQGFAVGSVRPFVGDVLKCKSLIYVQTMGIGYRIRINTNTYIKFETTLALTNSDFIDGYSAKGSKYNDAFITNVIKFSYLFAHPER